MEGRWGGEIRTSEVRWLACLLLFCCGVLPADNEPLEIEYGTNLRNVHVRLKEPFTENLHRLNNEMKKNISARGYRV